jgi:hypothetical protein
MLTTKRVTVELVQRWLDEKFKTDPVWVARLRKRSRQAQAEMRAKGYL